MQLYIGNYDKAIDMEKQVLDFRGRRLGERHPDYCLSMKEIAKRYYLIGDYANASDYIMKATKQTEDEIMANFSDMTSVERTLYWDVNAGWLNEWMSNGWRTAGKKEVKNIDLWQELIRLMNKHTVCFVKVKGHADNEYNNACDKGARAEITKHKKASE